MFIEWMNSLSDEQFWCFVITLCLTIAVVGGLFICIGSFIVEETTLWLKRRYRI